MELIPARNIKTAPPRYDVEALALHVAVGAGVDHHIAETVDCGAVLFDCNRDGIVVGIEVLVSKQGRLAYATLQSPENLADGLFNIKLGDDPQVENMQTYDTVQQRLQVGVADSSQAFQISKYVFVATAATGHLTLWIDGLALPSD
jgi:hypothetical protein